MANRVQFKPDEKSESGVHSNSDSRPQFVLVDGERVGVVRKRSEWYGNLGRRGSRYHYYDFFRLGADGKAVRETTVVELRDGTKREEHKPLASDSTRKQSVAAGLALLGYLDAARTVDADHADFTARKMEES